MKFIFFQFTPFLRRTLISTTTSPSSLPLIQPSLAATFPKKVKTLQHYNEICTQYPGFVVLYQVGDFYEMYDNIALEASKLLDMRISQKPMISSSHNSTATIHNSIRTMAGFPLSSLNSFIEKFIKAGKSVVVCDQHSVPNQEKKEFYRQVNRIITPGTLVDDNLLNRSSNNFILCLYSASADNNIGIADIHSNDNNNSNKIGLAWADVSTGLLRFTSVEEGELLDELSRISCTELLLPIGGLEGLKGGVRERVLHFLRSSPSTQLSPPTPSIQYTINPLKKVEEESTSFLLQYIEGTLLDRKPFLEKAKRYQKSSFMVLPQSVIKSLELLENSLSGLRQNSLLKSIDRTLTSMGSRLLLERLQSPLTSIPLINERLRKIDLFMSPHNQFSRFVEKDIRSALQGIKDIERAFQRIVLHRFRSVASGNSSSSSIITSSTSNNSLIRDFLIIADSSKLYQEIKNLLPQEFESISLSPSFLLLTEKIISAMQYSLGIGKVKDGYCAVLDSFKDDGHLLKERDIIFKKLKKRNPSLKPVIRDDGFFFTLPKNQTPLMSKDDGVRLTFSLKNSYRYTTPELEDLFYRSTSLETSFREREAEILKEFKDSILENETEIHCLSSIIAEIDLVLSNVTISRERNFCRPTLLPIGSNNNNNDYDNNNNNNPSYNNDNIKTVTTTTFDVKNVKHPIVLEKNFESGRQFVGNSLKLGTAGNFAFITGSNMGGKSTFLRQNAILAIMAQSGMYVAADSATLSIVDAIYTRIGSCDDLVNDKSTFWMEMEECSIILKNSTPNSLLLMDEVGRGTGSKEGFAIAYGIFRNIYSKGSRCLFATHYLDLALETMEGYPGTQRLMTGVRLLPNNDIAFLHRIEKGVAMKSHAISIAKFAGVPQDVLDNAEARLLSL